MQATMFITGSNFVCASRQVQIGGHLGKLIVITAPVGGAARCPNRTNDVRTIQNALNTFSPNEGGPLQRLAVDGFCGPKTRAAIVHFQQKWGLKKTDDVVDVNGPTIKRLRAGPGPITHPAVEFAALIPRVIEIVTAAQMVLTLAESHFTVDSGLRAGQLHSLGDAAAAKVERHFHLSKTAQPRVRIVEIERIFLGMQTAIGHIPQGLVLAADEPPTFALGAYMFSFGGGYSLRKAGDIADGMPLDTIYLCPRAHTLTVDGFAYGMVHELAHYVGPTVNIIRDVAYFHVSPERYRKLTADEAFHNADCYAQFAYDAIGKPDFVP